MPEESNFETYLSIVTSNSLEVQLPVRISQEELKYSTVIMKGGLHTRSLIYFKRVTFRPGLFKTWLQMKVSNPLHHGAKSKLIKNRKNMRLSHSNQRKEH